MDHFLGEWDHYRKDKVKKAGRQGKSIWPRIPMWPGPNKRGSRRPAWLFSESPVCYRTRTPIRGSAFGGNRRRNMTAAEIVDQLKPLGTDAYKNVLRKHGIPEPLFGVKIVDL